MIHPEYTAYDITEDGQVYSLVSKYGLRKKPFLMKQHITRYGYNRISLFVDGVDKKYHVHRLVAQTYIPNPDNLPQVNHIDEDKTNNNVTNLEWCSGQYNLEYSNSKYYTILNVNSGEIFTIKNLSKWCRENGCVRDRMIHSYNRMLEPNNTKWRKKHKCYRVLQICGG